MLETLHLFALSVEIPDSWIFEVLDKGGTAAAACLVLWAVLTGRLVTPKRFEDNVALQERLIAAEMAGRLAAEKREKWWRDLYLRREKLGTMAQEGLEEAVSLLEESQS